MKLSEFKIGGVFYIGPRKWLCTDIGTRTVAAICLSDATVVRNGKRQPLSETALKDWTNGPPYALAEQCLDEDDCVACTVRLSGNASAPRSKNGARFRLTKSEALA